MKRIGKYQILSSIGKGAMGEVFKAKDENIERIVAIKVIHPHFLEQDVWEDMKARFKQEATAAARCLHPNIVTVFDFGVFEDTPYLVMEYIEGADVRSILDNHGSFSMKDAINIMCAVLNALHYAHEKGVIHRDIKPANIIKLNNGQIKVADFGIARIDSSNLTNVGDMVGTPIYMSPEALRGDTVDARSDIYASALVLLELLSGAKPITGYMDRNTLTEQIITANISADFQQSLLNVLVCALHRKAEHRFQSAEDFANKLILLLQGEDIDKGTAPLHMPLPDDNETIIIESVLRQEPRGEVSHAEDNDSAFSQGNILTEVEQSLASYIGPLSSILVKRTVSSCSNLSQIINKLAQHISDSSQRTDFIKKFDDQYEKSSIILKVQTASAVSQANVSIEISEEKLALIIEKLAIYLGPMAAMIVKRSIKKHSNQEEFIAALAEKIPQKTERDEFIESVV